MDIFVHAQGFYAKAATRAITPAKAAALPFLTAALLVTWSGAELVVEDRTGATVTVLDGGGVVITTTAVEVVIVEGGMATVVTVDGGGTAVDMIV